MSKSLINFGRLILKKRNNIIIFCFLLFGCNQSTKINTSNIFYKEFGDDKELSYDYYINVDYRDSNCVQKGKINFNGQDSTNYSLENSNDSIFIGKNYENRNLAYSLIDTSQIIVKENKGGELPFFPYSTKCISSKKLNYKNKEYIIQKFYVNKSLNSESFNIIYFLRGFGFICIHRYYRHSYIIPIKFINSKFGLDEISNLIVKLRNDSAFYEKDNFVPPKVINE